MDYCVVPCKSVCEIHHLQNIYSLTAEYTNYSLVVVAIFITSVM
jgi:hypothetical protein